MPARRRTRSRRRSQATQVRQRQVAPRYGYGQALEEFLNPWTILGLVLFGIVVTGPKWYPVARGALAGSVQALARAFGLGMAPGGLLMVLAVLFVRRRGRGRGGALHRTLGAAGLLLVVWGTLGLWHPAGLRLAGVGLEEASAGGKVGAWLAGGPGTGAWVWLVLLAVVSVVVLYPGMGLRLARRALAGQRIAGSLLLRGAVVALARLYRTTALASRRTLVMARWRLQAWSEERARRRVARLQAKDPVAPAAVRETTEEALADAGRGAETSVAVEATATTAEREQGRQEPRQMTLPSFEQVVRSRWELPPIKLLENPPQVALSASDNEKRAQLIVDTLANYGVDASVVTISQGPTVTQFGVEPGWDVRTRRVVERDSNGQAKRDKDGRPITREEVSRTRVKVSRITALANDLALALAAPSIRIEAPVPGKPVVGIEVPNTDSSLVTLRSVVESTPFQRVKARSKLALALGKTVAGEAVAADLARMPHLLIAGATGSGKSVCINSIVSCLMLHATPDEVRFLMIDPKRVELMSFASVPHLLGPVVTDVEEVLAALRWVTMEMESRYRKFAALAVRNIDAYNKNPRVVERLPYIVVVIDELADLMMVSAYDVERAICRLAQLARATGIHLVIATQRPSVDVVTGLIKANFPTRIAFAVSSQVDSRTILDSGGAEKLLGRGDMLFLPTDVAKPKRLQGAFISDAEIERLVAFWNREEWADIRPSQVTREVMRAAVVEDEEASIDEDPLLDQARRLAAQHERISTSFLQRRLRVGYPRAAKLIDRLEDEGIVAPQEGSQPRRVLVGDSGNQSDFEDAPSAV